MLRAFSSLPTARVCSAAAVCAASGRGALLLAPDGCQFAGAAGAFELAGDVLLPGCLLLQLLQLFGGGSVLGLLLVQGAHGQLVCLVRGLVGGCFLSFGGRRLQECGRCFH